ncbi:MAG: hypothetical protein BGO37_11935 [Cellulomonas sp. 73-92]|uniref:SseB family protein n=1 Tax=Micrococcales TaxID=85006 RepID=UPI00092C6ADF|nr:MULTISPECIES: SseB family protein [Micrococcales]MBN9190321.1 SseB family protein [Microbacterium sp.]MBN9192973.1 SseB family protein [Microbacterium sp.]OJV75022.1 MAG: hypothetical protein BGO37_11935 [Cellulomonas sp. 73-92]
MALFSRRPKPSDAAPGTDAADTSDPAGTAESEAAAPLTDAAADEAAVPQVGISTSSFGGFGSTQVEAAPEPSGEAPPPEESLPGLPDNVLLRDALAALDEDPDAAQIFNVARQLLQGNVYLRVKGDAQALLRAGEDLPLAVATRDDGQFVMLYSGGVALAEAVNADGDTQTSAMGQAIQTVLQYVLRGEFAGVVIDQSSAPASVVLPRALIGRAVEEMDPELTLKHLLAAPRTDATAAAVVEAMTTAPLWVAVNRASEEDAWGVAESHTPAGERILDVFSHPLEVVALGRGDQPTPFTAAQLAAALASDAGLSGVVLDPGGPWIRLTRAQLAPVLELAE